METAIVVLVWWLTAGVFVAYFWAVTAGERKHPKPPNQWKKYRGIMHLPARVGEKPPMDTADLIQALKKRGKK